MDVLKSRDAVEEKKTDCVIMHYSQGFCTYGAQLVNTETQLNSKHAPYLPDATTFMVHDMTM